MKYNERFLCSYCLLLYYILSYIPNPNLGGIPIPETDTGPAQVGADDLAGVGIAAIAPLLLADLWTMVDPIDLLDHTVGKAIESTTMTYRFDGIKTIKKIYIYIYISFQMGVTRSNVSNVASWELPEVIFQV